MENWFILIGLIFDVIGVVLIAIPILTLRRGEVQPRYYAEDMSKQKKYAWAGVLFLGTGFVLQIVGNL